MDWFDLLISCLCYIKKFQRSLEFHHSSEKNDGVILSELLLGLPGVSARQRGQLPEISVTAITQDSREVVPGSLFIAVKGIRADGHEFVSQAIENGAAALVLQRGRVPPEGLEVPVFEVDDTTAACHFLARRFYGDPSQRLLCIGVTGTNGKTSITFILEHLLTRAQIPAGVIGTIDNHIRDRVWPARQTTPEALQLQRRIAEMKAEGAQAVVMEVSSHALSQGRVEGVQFNIAVFTNLTRDHLDYHGSMKSYFEAKQKLFTDLLWKSFKVPLFAIVNIDDEWGRRLRVSSRAGLWTYGRRTANKPAAADFSFSISEMSFSGSRLELETPFGRCRGTIPLCGEHNAYNVTAAIAAMATVGFHPEQSLRWMEGFAGVPGRLQTVPNVAKNVFIDYAHTPDALEKVLMTLHQVRETSKAGGRIITVFGCGGDRDPGKRPLMVQIAENLSDEVILTSDNPRHEDPEKILDQMEAGAKSARGTQGSRSDPANSFAAHAPAKIRRQVDRKKAIGEALASCRPEDVVLIAGKGHELYQQVGEERIPFSDLAVVREFIGQVGALGTSAKQGLVK
ncbi:MAG: UDP-N-acetylmuramoyl-L-alanyl-D-glutamate--2,6-diaminopimelate ligase [Bdellovibrio sp.]|nr:MAG: UDP-N-acetylmuramoyl-L-alanyl-D-glutamate--2,6-diaminopimelate ligase [Bdellovibrio sp.]